MKKQLYYLMISVVILVNPPLFAMLGKEDMNDKGIRKPFNDFRKNYGVPVKGLQIFKRDLIEEEAIQEELSTRTKYCRTWAFSIGNQAFLLKTEYSNSNNLDTSDVLDKLDSATPITFYGLPRQEAFVACLSHTNGSSQSLSIFPKLRPHTP